MVESNSMIQNYATCKGYATIHPSSRLRLFAESIDVDN